MRRFHRKEIRPAQYVNAFQANLGLTVGLAVHAVVQRDQARRGSSAILPPSSAANEGGVVEIVRCAFASV